MSKYKTRSVILFQILVLNPNSSYQNLLMLTDVKEEGLQERDHSFNVLV